MRSGTVFSMSIQIAVRLPDEVVAFLDQTVADGKAPSRAAVVTSAVERHMRLLMAQADAEALRRHGPADDLDPVVHWTAAHATSED